jgi:hypothetical protein
MQEATNEINKMKRQLSLLLRAAWLEVERVWQENSYKRKFEVGSLPQTRQKITSLRGDIISPELLRGLLRTISSRTGKRRVHCCGSVVNVCDFPTDLLALADGYTPPNCVAGSGKSIFWYGSHNSVVHPR